MSEITQNREQLVQENFDKLVAVHKSSAHQVGASDASCTQAGRILMMLGVATAMQLKSGVAPAPN